MNTSMSQDAEDDFIILENKGIVIESDDENHKSMVKSQTIALKRSSIGTEGDTVTESNNFSKFIHPEGDEGRMIQMEMSMDQKIEAKVESIIDERLTQLKSELAVQFLDAAAQDFDTKILQLMQENEAKLQEMKKENENNLDELKRGYDKKIKDLKASISGMKREKQNSQMKTNDDQVDRG